MTEVNVRRAATREDLNALHALRWQVFVEEQGVPPELESDEFDETACLALAWADGAASAPGGARCSTRGGPRRRMPSAPTSAGRASAAGAAILETPPPPGAVEVTSTPAYVLAFHLRTARGG